MDPKAPALLPNKPRFDKLVTVGPCRLVELMVPLTSRAKEGETLRIPTAFDVIESAGMFPLEVPRRIFCVAYCGLIKISSTTEFENVSPIFEASSIKHALSAIT